MIKRIVELSEVPDERRYRHHLEQLAPEILQHRLVVMEVEATQVKHGNFGRRNPKQMKRKDGA